MKTLFAILFFICAGISIYAGLANWDFFFEHGKARTWDKMIGRKATRILSVISGVLVLICGLMLLIYGD